MSPTDFVVERIQREHLKRLRRSIGVTGYELPEDGRRTSWRVVALCALGIAAVARWAWAAGVFN